MIKIVFLRHFQTLGNLSNRYIGVTDEPIINQEYVQSEYRYPEVECVYCSPLLRCRQTAQLIFPTCQRREEILLSECDFGDFENKNYLELEHNIEYQRWIDSGGILRFPNGEDPLEFRRRSVRGFRHVVNQSVQEKHQTIAIVAHGGTIMSVMEHLTSQGSKRSELQKHYMNKGFYDWKVGNGEGYILELEEEEWKLWNICHTHSLL